jgi:hypothetical protein
MANLIRVKQLDQPDLSGFFNDAFINTGIFDAKFVDKFTDQNISGVKTFIDGVNLNNVDNLSLSGVDISITSGNIALTNRPTVNGTGVVLNGELNNTGILLNNRINSLSGLFTEYNLTLDATFASDIQLANTGSDLFNRINSLSGTLTGNYSTITNLANTGSTLVNRIDSLSGTLTGNLANTGSTLVNRIDSLSGTLTGNYSTITNLANTGSNLFNRINSLSGSAVLITGNQTISGVKTFATGVNISGHVGIGIDSNNFNLYVRKSSAGAVNPDSSSIAVFEGSGNSHITVLASNAQTAGVVLGSPADNFGSYLSWNHDNSALKLATAKTNGFIQILTNDENEAVRITRSGDVGIGTISPSEKLEVVGNIKASGASFTKHLTVNTTGVLLSGQNSFILPFSNTTDTAAPNMTYYFSNLAYTLRIDTGQAKVIALDNFIARKASWTTHTSSFTPATISTGYFYNLTKNTSGIISDVIRLPLKDTIYNYGGILNPPIAVNINDEVAIALKTGPSLNNQGHSGFRNSVNVYCYN